MRMGAPRSRLAVCMAAVAVLLLSVQTAPGFGADVPLKNKAESCYIPLLNPLPAEV